MKLNTALAMFPDSGKSERAEAADTIQVAYVRQRKIQFGVLFFTIVAVEASLWHYDVEAWIQVVAAVLWIGYLIYIYGILILHELWEMNDQLAGRKDEFRHLVLSRPAEPD